MPALVTNPDGSPHIHTWVRGYDQKGQKDPNRCVCQHPDCITTMTRSELIGKRSLCAVCGLTQMILTRNDLRRSRPRCLECSTTQKALAIKKKKSILEELGIK